MVDQTPSTGTDTGGSAGGSPTSDRGCALARYQPRLAVNAPVCRQASSILIDVGVAAEHDRRRSRGTTARRSSNLNSSMYQLRIRCSMPALRNARGCPTDRPSALTRSGREQRHSPGRRPRPSRARRHAPCPDAARIENGDHVGDAVLNAYAAISSGLSDSHRSRAGRARWSDSPASLNAATWLRHRLWSSGQPCMNSTGVPSSGPSTNTSIPTPPSP